MSEGKCPLGEDCDLTLAYMMGAEKAKDTIKALRAEVDRLQGNLRAELGDHIHGTPCAQIRWQQEREELQAEVERLRAALRSLVSYTQCHYVDGYCVQHSSPDPCEMAEARAALDGQPRAGEGGVMEYSIELWQDGQKVAAVHSDSASNALWAIAGYAAQYEQDGPVTVRVKNKNKNKKRKTAND